MRPAPTILILAAGLSRRMRGADKLLEPVDGIPVLRRLVDMAEGLGEVIVTLPPAPHARHDLLDGTDARRIAVPNAANGMAESLKAGARAAQEDKDLLVLLADLPELGREDLARVIDARTAAPEALIWRGATEAGKPGHPILFDARLLPEFADLTGDAGAKALAKRYADRLHLVPLPRTRALTDLDTPEDWVAWRNRTGR